jgi:hypothetical protein
VLIVEVGIRQSQCHFNTQQPTFDNRHSYSTGCRHVMTMGMIAAAGTSSAGLQDVWPRLWNEADEQAPI